MDSQLNINDVNNDNLNDVNDNDNFKNDNDLEFLVNSKVKVINNNKTYNDIIKNNNKVVILYGTDTCITCLKYKPFFIRLSNKYYKKISFLYTDIDETNLSFKNVPVLFFIINGKELFKLDKNIDSQSIKQFVGVLLKL